MNTIDLIPIVQPVLAVAGTVIAGLLAIYVPMALAAFQKWTGIVLTEQQRQTFLGAVQTAKGMIETKLDQGILTHAHIGIANDDIRAEAAAAIAAVPTAAAALGMTQDGVARMIAGAVDTSAHGTATPPSGATVIHLTSDDIARMIIERAGITPHPAI